MRKHKGGLISKPSKASLKSRGLSSATNRGVRPASRASSVDGCYSLYSTDSEDNVVGVSKGLDRCAELLTNILEARHGEQEDQELIHVGIQSHPAVAAANRKSKYNTRLKPALHKGKDGQKLKRKSKAPIYIPTSSDQCNQQQSKSKPSYNEAVVSSTPVLTTDQRKRQQELQQRENALQEQIHLLQTQYENLQKHGQELVYDKKRSDQETEKSPKNLDFSTDAEKPLIEELKEKSGAASESVSVTLSDVNNIGKETAEKQARKVQFQNEDLCESQESERENSVRIRTDLTKDVPSDSTCVVDTSYEEERLTGTPPALERENRKKRISRKEISIRHTPHRNADHLRILTYLVGELKAALGTSGDVEVERLLMEIENEVQLLFYTPHSSESSPVVVASKQHDIETEVALQPLRSENSVLRRKLRIANQRVREMENQSRQTVLEKDRSYYASETLYQQLLKERENVGKLTLEKKQVFDEYRQEKLKSQHLLSEKEEELHSLQEELKRQKSKVITVDNNAKLQFEAIGTTLCAKNKEVALLNLALRQRDAEIERLTELTRGLQHSLTRVLTNVQELHPDDVASEMSSLSLLESWKPIREGIPKQSNDASVESSYGNKPPDLTNNLYDGSKTSIAELAREYSSDPMDTPPARGVTPHVHEHINHSTLSTPCSTETLDTESQEGDDTVSISSADEFVFKQELANLDTVIARLQKTLRDK